MHNRINYSTNRMTDERRTTTRFFKELMMRKLVVPAFAALSLATFAQPATAEQVVVKVAYADLDLASPSGVATLQARIAGAVKTACAKPDLRDLKSMQVWSVCVADAKAKADAKVKEKVQLASL
jgi:UrcA family protein